MDLFDWGFVYEDRANAAIEAASDRWNVEHVINAIEWAILHDRQIGSLLNERGLRGFVYPGAQSINEPDVDVIYETRSPRIMIHDLVFREAVARHAGRA